MLSVALPCVFALTAALGPQASPLASWAWGTPDAGLRMAISPAGADDKGYRQFHVAIENVGDKDVVLNLGVMLANGKDMFPTAVTLVLTDAKGATTQLRHNYKRRGGIAGRLDDFIVALPAGGIYVLRLSLHDYWSPDTKTFDLLKLPGGTARIGARFDGRGATATNLDTPGIALLNFWKGTVQSGWIGVQSPSPLAP